jgi:hypothetical protein
MDAIARLLCLQWRQHLLGSDHGGVRHRDMQAQGGYGHDKNSANGTGKTAEDFHRSVSSVGIMLSADTIRIMPARRGRFIENDQLFLSLITGRCAGS